MCNFSESCDIEIMLFTELHNWTFFTTFIRKIVEQNWAFSPRALRSMSLKVVVVVVDLVVVVVVVVVVTFCKNSKFQYMGTVHYESRQMAHIVQHYISVFST